VRRQLAAAAPAASRVDAEAAPGYNSGLMTKRILSGIQPSGKLHIGNYLGAIKQHLDAQQRGDWDRFYFIANYHAMTTSPDPETLRENTLDVAP
jgi:tryptophanyl-tRNA synthetase